MSKKKNGNIQHAIKSYNKKKSNDFKNSGHNIINGSKSIYTNTVTSLDGMKPDKRTCIYFDKNNQKCKNKKCSKVICTTARNCTCYKRTEKISKEELSPYDENYITLPLQSGTHEKTNEYISVSKNIGTPCHVGYIQGDGHRRHKTHCLYYDKANKSCKWFVNKCIGSSHCEKYEESSKN